MGRYWTKEERKKHLEKSRERKHRQEVLLASQTIEENGDAVGRPLDRTHSGINRKTANNIDNTAKKHKTKRSHKEEVLGQAVPKVGPNAGNVNVLGLLSVTTV